MPFLRLSSSTDYSVFDEFQFWVFMFVIVGGVLFIFHRYDQITTQDSTIIHVKTPKHNPAVSMSPYTITINITQQLRNRRMSDLNLNDEVLPTRATAKDIETAASVSTAVYPEETKKTL
jgi:hypothetical protein